MLADIIRSIEKTQGSSPLAVTVVLTIQSSSAILCSCLQQVSELRPMCIRAWTLCCLLSASHCLVCVDDCIEGSAYYHGCAYDNRDFVLLSPTALGIPMRENSSSIRDTLGCECKESPSSECMQMAFAGPYTEETGYDVSGRVSFGACQRGGGHNTFLIPSEADKNGGQIELPGQHRYEGFHLKRLCLDIKPNISLWVSRHSESLSPEMVAGRFDVAYFTESQLRSEILFYFFPEGGSAPPRPPL